MMKPEIVDAKVSIVDAVAGSAGGGCARCLPPTPRAVTNATMTGIQASLSYLYIETARREHQGQEAEVNAPVEDSIAAKGDL